MKRVDADDVTNWTCPLPLRQYGQIVMGHGGGGKLSADLVEHLILPALGGQSADCLGDSTVLPPLTGRMAISTDSYVVRPILFPGGSIGELAVNGTVNDLAMSGAWPLYMTAGLILEEGLALTTLAEVLNRMGQAARQAGVRIVAGDTKVVGRGQADGIFIHTAGVGEVPEGVEIGPGNARPGDVILLSGSVGDHGMAILCAREELEFDGVIQSDCAALHRLVRAMLEAAGPGAVRVLRDPTRGGLAAALHEIARSSRVGMEIEEGTVPVDDAVRSACELMGLDPLQVASEGKLVAMVDAGAARQILAAMRLDPLGERAVEIGRVTDRHPGMLTARTAIGGQRVIPMPIGEQLPRIC